jgi:hypothetical protein
VDTLTRPAAAAVRRRRHYEGRISAAQSLISKLGRAWGWVLAECRYVSKERNTRWRRRGRDADEILADALDTLVGLARRLNDEGGRR